MSARHRVARAVEAHRSAAEAIGPITPGLAVFLMTRGQFSMLDMILHVLDQIGPAAVSVWTWAVADYEVQALAGLMGRRSLTAGRLIVDRSAEVRLVATIDAWRARFGVESVRVCRNHAKIARVWNDHRRVVIRGSMNLNLNPRFEQADVTEGDAAFDLVAEIEDALPALPRLCSHHAAAAASQLGQFAQSDDLAMFDGVKPWRR